jgi:hypothetical protein
MLTGRRRLLTTAGLAARESEAPQQPAASIDAVVSKIAAHAAPRFRTDSVRAVLFAQSIREQRTALGVNALLSAWRAPYESLRREASASPAAPLQGSPPLAAMNAAVYSLCRSGDVTAALAAADCKVRRHQRVV